MFQLSDHSPDSKTGQSAKLIDVKQMRALVDDTTITRERWAGMIKSLVAIKDPMPQESP